MKRLSAFVMSGLLVMSIAACSSQPKQAKKKAENLKGLSTDALQPLMSKTQSNLRNLVYGLMNFKKDKVQSSTANLIEITDFLTKDTQYSQSNKGVDWQALCDQQRNLLGDIQSNFEAKQYSEASQSFGKLVKVCIQCHLPFRKIP